MKRVAFVGGTLGLMWALWFAAYRGYLEKADVLRVLGGELRRCVPSEPVNAAVLTVFGALGISIVVLALMRVGFGLRFAPTQARLLTFLAMVLAFPVAIVVAPISVAGLVWFAFAAGEASRIVLVIIALSLALEWALACLVCAAYPARKTRLFMLLLLGLAFLSFSMAIFGFGCPV